MKKLLIVESPAKIKTISKFLGKDFKIMSTLGHIKDLPKRELGVHMNDSIKLDYVVMDKKGKVINDICKEAIHSDEIFLAPDPDREGEIIAWHIAEEIKARMKNPHLARITFNEITKPAIEDALKHPSQVDLDKVAAQQARRVLDRWVGYEVSPVLWKKVSKGLSAGRVQSVALRLICMREEEIKAFKPEEYWSIIGLFLGEDVKLSATLLQKSKKKISIGTKDEADKVIADLKKQDYIISSIKDAKRLKNPAPPFMTSTLQQAAYNQLGFSVDKTMSIAQKLYEGIPLGDSNSPVALITYMRTDSLRLSDTALKNAHDFILKKYGEDYLPAKSIVYSKSGAQDAHEAIRPIDVENSPEKVSRYLEKDTAKLYDLIFKRFVACQMKPAQYAQRQVNIEGGPYLFRATGSTLIFDGYLKAYGVEQDEDDKEKEEDNAVLPKNLKEKMALTLNKITPKQHFTEPPPRYTQASLVKEMEKEGIGRPSTYATILKTIQARAYTYLDDKKRFVPTDLGILVTKLLVENLPKIMDIKFTATMEEDLDKIAEGKLERDKLLRAFYKDFEKDLIAFAGQKIQKGEVTNLKCPKCKEGDIILRFGRTGQFAGCSRFPACNFTSNFTRNPDGTITLEQAAGPKLLEEKCPKCGKPLRQLVGRFGPFVACSGYPECKYIQQKTAKFPCPQCGGKLVYRTSKRGSFWGCSNYPKCKFLISGDISETPCPKCKSPYLLKYVSKDGKETLTCPNKNCGYKITTEIAETTEQEKE